MMKGNDKIKKIFLSVTVIGCFLLLCCFILSGITIKKIQVSGNEKYSSEEIIEMLFDGKWDYNPLYLYYKDKTKEHESIPFIQDYKIIFQGLDEVEIIIYEKDMIGCLLYMSNYMYFDRDGIIVESSGEQIPGIPLISGLDFGKIILYQPLSVGQDGVFERILNLTQVLTINEIEVDKISYDKRLNATLYIANSDVKVNLGNEESLNNKVSELKDMIRDGAFEERAGVFTMEKYRDDGLHQFFFKEE